MASYRENIDKFNRTTKILLQNVSDTLYPIKLQSDNFEETNSKSFKSFPEKS